MSNRKYTYVVNEHRSEAFVRDLREIAAQITVNYEAEYYDKRAFNSKKARYIYDQCVAVTLITSRWLDLNDIALRHGAVQIGSKLNGAYIQPKKW